MNAKKIVVKKIFGTHWVGSCPVCGPEKGFMVHRVWQLVSMWSTSHADMHRRKLFNVVEEVARHG